MNNYSFSEMSKNIYSFLLTKIFYHNMRFVRRPIYIRGKSSLVGGNNLTTGHFCRFDLLGNKKKTLFIGDNCEIGDNVHIVARERVEIGNNVLIASKVFISDTSHGRYDDTGETATPYEIPKRRELVTNPVKIGDNVWIGENVVILSGTSIGSGCVIGANSVVTKSIEENVVAVGIPAKPIKHYNHGWYKI